MLFWRCDNIFNTSIPSSYHHCFAKFTSAFESVFYVSVCVCVCFVFGQMLAPVIYSLSLCAAAALLQLHHRLPTHHRPGPAWPPREHHLYQETARKTFATPKLIFHLAAHRNLSQGLLISRFRHFIMSTAWPAICLLHLLLVCTACECTVNMCTCIGLVASVDTRLDGSW